MRLEHHADIKPVRDCAPGDGFGPPDSFADARQVLREYRSNTFALLRLRELLNEYDPTVDRQTDDQLIDLVSGQLTTGWLAWNRNVQAEPLGDPPRRKASTLSTTEAGLRFIYQHEGAGTHLYCPGGTSGVVLGPGYDMRDRSFGEVYTDLSRIGMSANFARIAAKGAGLSGREAQAFAEEYRRLIKITPDQGAQLLRMLAPSAESAVQQGIDALLLENEFDALVSFAYSTGGRAFDGLSELINNNKTGQAMNYMRTFTHFKGVMMPGLGKRREAEVRLFLYGEYSPGERR